MKEVTKDAFYAAVGDIDAVSEILDTPWPYTCVYKLRYSGKTLGKIVPVSDPEYPSIVEGHKYFLNN